MFSAIIIGALILGAVALVLYIDHLSESALKNKLSTELPQTTYADVESISKEYGKEYGTTYKLKAHQRDGSSKTIEVKCNSSSLSRYSRVRM